MAHALYHARSSAKRFGGVPGDYMDIHAFMDSTKALCADARHRLLLHNSWGIFVVERIFGPVLVRPSDGKEVPLRPIVEQHIIEDFGRIPGIGAVLDEITFKPWMAKDARQLSKVYGQEGDGDERYDLSETR